MGSILDANSSAVRKRIENRAYYCFEALLSLLTSDI